MTIKEKNEINKRRIFKRNISIVVCCAILFVLVFIVSVNTGYSKLTPMDTLRTIFGKGTEKQELILFQIRMPRIIISLVIGMGLALSGCIIQGISRNPLADPSLLGISAGSGLAVILYLMFAGSNSFSSIFALPIISLVGAGVAAFLVYILAYKKEEGIAPIRLILTGIAVQAGISALTTILVLKLDDKQYSFVAMWQAGTIWATNWKYVLAIIPWMCALIPFVMYKARTLDALSLGDEMAVGLGLSVEKERIVLLASAVALAAACIAVGGNIAFVGLVVPHLARRLVGSKHSILLPTCALIGAVLVASADTIGRVILQPSGVPTGVMTAIIGAPYFIYLLVKSKH